MKRLAEVTDSSFYWKNFIMLKVFEYICTSTSCSMFNKPVDRFLKASEENSQTCQYCHKLITKIFSSTKGYVKGTDNPVKC